MLLFLFYIYCYGSCKRNLFFLYWLLRQRWEQFFSIVTSVVIALFVFCLVVSYFWARPSLFSGLLVTVVARSLFVFWFAFYSSSKLALCIWLDCYCSGKLALCFLVWFLRLGHWARIGAWHRRIMLFWFEDYVSGLRVLFFSVLGIFWLVWNFSNVKLSPSMTSALFKVFT